MSDVIVFGFGVFVMLLVSAAVALLLWGAARESEDQEVGQGASGKALSSGAQSRVPSR